jgi:hypothetical protein
LGSSSGIVHPEHQDPAFLAALTDALSRANREVGQEVSDLQLRVASQNAVLAQLGEFKREVDAIRARLDAGDLSAIEDYRDLKRRFEKMRGER